MRSRLISLVQFLCPWIPELTGEVRNKSLVLDNLRIRNATIRDCTVSYGGGTTHIDTVQFHGCKWEVFGAAANTIKLLDAIGKDDPWYVLHAMPKTKAAIKAERAGSH